MIWFWIVAGRLTLAALLALLRPLVRQPRPERRARACPGALSTPARGHRCRTGARPADARAGAQRHGPRSPGVCWRRPSATGQGPRQRPAAARKRHGGSAPRSALPRCCRQRRSPSILRSAPRRRRSQRRDRRRSRRMAPPSSPPRPTGSRRICKRRRAISRAGPCSPAPWRRSAAFPRRARPMPMPSPWRRPRPASMPSSARCWCSPPRAQVTPAAEAEFAKAPDDPRSRYYGAEAALQRGDAAGARQNCRPCWPRHPPTRLAPGRCRPPRRAVAKGSARRWPILPQRRQAERAGRGGGPVDVARAAADDDPRHGPTPRRAARAQSRRQGRLGASRACLRHPRRAREGASRPRASSRPGRRCGSVGTAAAARTASAPIRFGASRSARRAQEGNAQFPGNLALLEAYQQALAGSVEDDRPSPELSLWRPNQRPRQQRA